MLKLENITKNYLSGDNTVKALKNINLSFRKSEFVSILGPSGCGKTTMLNIIGGLDQYTDGNLIINGKSTKEYKNRDWDTYRNHSIGFVFQSYNLISHQSVLSNVELALTLSGVSKSERRARAKEALEKVGLGDQLHKKPNQMSGGQMQRVAIARALVNDPDILLADEPTGALDTETSVQIMELLKEIAKDKLIIMVTHNPELAETYSTRIIRLLDGKVIDDSNPYNETEESNNKKQDDSVRKKSGKKTSMSLFTALSLSFNNLLTKKTRTFMTAFAGSIGIIGIALILSLSNGVQLYIDQVQKDTLTSYPITIQSQSTNVNGFMEAMSGKNQEPNKDMTKIYSNSLMMNVMSTMSKETKENNLQAFKKFIESKESNMDKYASDIQYVYDIQMNIYASDTSDGVKRINPTTLFDDMKKKAGISYMPIENVQIWQQMIGNQEMLDSQYDLVDGKWPTKANELVMIVDQNNQVSDYTLYALGLMDQNEVTDIMESMINGETFEPTQRSFTFDQILNTTYKLVLPTDYYKYDEKTSTWKDMSEDVLYMKNCVDNAAELKIVGIVKPSEDSNVVTTGMMGYTSALSEYLINQVNETDIVKQQLANPDVDVFTGIKFDAEQGELTMERVKAYIATLPDEEQSQMNAYISSMSEEEVLTMFSKNILPNTTQATYDDNIKLLGIANLDNPSGINIYADDFESKDDISDIIEKYNNDMNASGNEDKVIEYTDYVALMMSSVTTIINAISYILIAFVGISLIVSSIMIGIITYISVLERTKEIGILRSIGASKKDISRVFNAETLIVGFVAGLLGIIVTCLLLIPINIVIKNLTDISGLAKLPVAGAVILVLISMLLTFIAGLIPSRIASKKDPVIALRTE